MGQSKADIILVYAVDQLLDYYELNNKPLPEKISVDGATYAALCIFVKDEKLTHYRKVLLKRVSKNTKT